MRETVTLIILRQGLESRAFQGRARFVDCLQSTQVPGIRPTVISLRSWTVYGHGQVAATVSSRTVHGYWVIEVSDIARTPRGLKRDCRADIPGLCTDGHGHCGDFARKLHGNHGNAARKSRRTFPRTSCGNSVDARRIFGGPSADIYFDKGMVSNQNERLSSPESCHKSVRLNASPCTALSGASTTLR